MNSHYQHLIAIFIVILVVLGLFSFRLSRLKKQGDTRKISLRRIVLLFILLIYASIVRIIKHPELAQSLTLIWLLPLMVSAWICYRNAQQHPISRDEKTGHYLVPNKIYLRLLYILLPYVIIILVLVLINPALANSSNFLLITTFISGIISGFYMGYGVGFVVQGRRQTKD